MFPIVSRVATLVIVAVLAVIVPTATLAFGSSTSPTASQIRERVSRAESSGDVWATVNICGSRPGSFGVRGQIPALGFKAGLSMEITVQYWMKPEHRWASDPAATTTVRLGSYVTGLYQGGYTFQFDPPALLRAEITFVWQLGSSVIGSTTRLTTAGIQRADFGDPAGYSRATCTIS
jgi:hypothetical protein